MPLKQTIKGALPPPLWAGLKRLRHVYTRCTFPARAVVHRYGNSELTVHIGDPLARGWYDHDWEEPQEIALLRKGKLRPGARVFDLGAHQCVVALMLADCVAPNGSVVALEASRYDAGIGRRNRELNGSTNLEILHAAVAAESGFIDFSLDGCVSRPGFKSGHAQVPAFSIDRLSEMYGYADVIYLDVEGFECQALQGARKTLQRKPDCFVEVHVHAGLERFGGSAAEVLSYFAREDYDLYAYPARGGSMQRLDNNPGVLQEHFYLVALSKS